MTDLVAEILTYAKGLNEKVTLHVTPDGQFTISTFPWTRPSQSESKGNSWEIAGPSLSECLVQLRSRARERLEEQRRHYQTFGDEIARAETALEQLP